MKLLEQSRINTAFLSIVSFKNGCPGNDETIDKKELRANRPQLKIVMLIFTLFS